MQLSLLDQLTPRPDHEFSTARRIELDATSWIEHVPDWLSGHQKILQLLIETADWEQHRRAMYDRVVDVPRLVAGVPGSRAGLDFYDGHVQRFPSRAPLPRVEEATELLAGMAHLLSVRYRKVLESVTLAHYRGGSDSVAFHGDKMGPLRGDTVVAIVSVGERRRFLLRPAHTFTESGAALPHPDNRTARGGALSFQFGGGDLLVMGGACQRDYEHAVPKMRDGGSRIAIMFRESVKIRAASVAIGSRSKTVKPARKSA